MASLSFPAKATLVFFTLAIAAPALTLSARPAAAECGRGITLPAHDDSTQAYSFSGEPKGAVAALVLLVGGGGFIKLGDDGCARKLKGNSLIRQIPYFHAGGMVTALVDAPSDRREKDGLGGFRSEAAHADDIGKVIADVRARTNLPVWLAGTSRGTISAANIAGRLEGPAAPDGVILTSPLTKRAEKAHKPWAMHDVFMLDLAAIKMPLLVVVHEKDSCIRTPPPLGAKIVEKASSARKQSVVVTGGPPWTPGDISTDCGGSSPHGFIEQWEEVAAGIVRFVRGGAY